jgi:hypothetical protein
MTIERAILAVLIAFILSLQLQVISLNTNVKTIKITADVAESIGHHVADRVDNACTILNSRC